ncbi:hypothetical protein [Pseudomonas sp. Gutcm_11s]|uniref:hypothetical protein n=1 Tax=Pseudomonas sp. Gutcm_11s TaxID=3026088 RepID=UPI002362F716|nr:hypothetical protein [Pseudomonas sp. Gutcm_11s]MDD0841889.1 hypothetical protein [Pseudomonas sp. Gutcm_11s]
MPVHLRTALVSAFGLISLLYLPLAIGISGVLLWLPEWIAERLDPFYVNLLLSATLTGLVVGWLQPRRYLQAGLTILALATLVTLIRIALERPTEMPLDEWFELLAANLQAINSDLLTSAVGLLGGAWIGSRRRVKTTQGASDPDHPDLEPPAGV